MSELNVGQSENKTVSCRSDRVFPRPVHVWSGREGVDLLEEQLEVEMLEGTHLVSVSSRVTVTGLSVNNNSDTTSDMVLGLAVNLQKEHFSVSCPNTQTQIINTVGIKGKPPKQNCSKLQ